MLRLLAFCGIILTAHQAGAVERSAPFGSIDGGTLSVSEWDGQPVLVVNTASQCAFTKQYRALQDLYDRYRARGLIVLAVPSDDFRQELDTNAEVKEFCELQYGIDMPMTVITPVKGENAHPLFRSIREETGFEPSWNFNKVLIGPDGSVVGTYGSTVRPLSGKITKAIEALLD